MTNSSPFGNGSPLLDLLEGMSGFAGRNLPNYSSHTGPAESDDSGPKYKRADQIGIGTEVVTPEGTTVIVESASRVGPDGSIEFVFSDTDVLTVWPNVKFEVKG